MAYDFPTVIDIDGSYLDNISIVSYKSNYALRDVLSLTFFPPFPEPP